MKLRICGLANVVGSATFILVGSFAAVASAETPVERGCYLVNSVGACGNCHGRHWAQDGKLVVIEREAADAIADHPSGMLTAT
jgi:hypothetical protein